MISTAETPRQRSARAQWRDPSRRAHLLATQILACERRRVARLIETSGPLAAQIARRYAWTGLDRDDLSQAAILGIMTAAERFDPSRGVWASFAWWYMRDSIQREVHAMRSTIRVPRRATRRAPTVAALDDAALLVVDKHAADPPTEAHRADLRERVRAALATLDPREAEIVSLVFGIGSAPHSLAEVAARFGFGSGWARVLQSRALDRLRASLGPV